MIRSLGNRIFQPWLGEAVLKGRFPACGKWEGLASRDGAGDLGQDLEKLRDAGEVPACAARLQSAGECCPELEDSMP